MKWGSMDARFDKHRDTGVEISYCTPVFLHDDNPHKTNGELS
jgi:hypothetical protein